MRSLYPKKEEQRLGPTQESESQLGLHSDQNLFKLVTFSVKKNPLLAGEGRIRRVLLHSLPLEDDQIQTSHPLKP